MINSSKSRIRIWNVRMKRMISLRSLFLIKQDILSLYSPQSWFNSPVPYYNSRENTNLSLILLWKFFYILNIGKYRLQKLTTKADNMTIVYCLKYIYINRCSSKNVINIYLQLRRTYIYHLRVITALLLKSNFVRDINKI